MFLGSPLLNPNAYVSISVQTAAKDADGRTVLTAPTVLENNVPLIVSEARGARDKRYTTDINLDAGSFSGESSNLGRQDVTITFLSSSLAGIPVGQSARLLDVTDHPASPDGWIPARYKGRWEVIQFGAGS